MNLIEHHVCRLLALGSRTTADLASALGLSSPQSKRALIAVCGRLRRANVITRARRGGRNGMYVWEASWDVAEHVNGGDGK